MGTFGVEVLARTDMALGSLSSIVGIEGEFEREREFTNGWRWASIYRGIVSDEALAALVAETGAPVLLAEVCGSDFAIVGFASPTSSVRRFFLHPDSAETYRDAGEPVDPVDPAAQAAAPAALLAWAGDGADAAEIAKAVNGRLLFVEDSVLRLAAALGAFPVADLADYTFGPADERS